MKKSVLTIAQFETSSKALNLEVAVIVFSFIVSLAGPSFFDNPTHLGQGVNISTVQLQTTQTRCSGW